MSAFVTSTAHGTTGVKTITCGFQPTMLRLKVGAKYGVTDTTYHYSEGSTDGTDEIYNTSYMDKTAGGGSKEGFGQLIKHYELVNGTWTKVLEIAFDSFTSTQAKYNVTQANANYTIGIEILG